MLKSFPWHFRNFIILHVFFCIYTVTRVKHSYFTPCLKASFTFSFYYLSEVPGLNSSLVYFSFCQCLKCLKDALSTLQPLKLDWSYQFCIPCGVSSAEPWEAVFMQDHVLLLLSPQRENWVLLCTTLSCLNKWRLSLKVHAHGRSLSSISWFRPAFSEFPEVSMLGLINLSIVCALKAGSHLEILVLETSVACSF